MKFGLTHSIAKKLGSQKHIGEDMALHSANPRKSTPRTRSAGTPLAGLAVVALLMSAAIVPIQLGAVRSGMDGSLPAAASSTLTFTANADARVSKSAPNRNYGTAGDLQAVASSKSTVNTYIRFNVSGLVGAVESARLRVYCTTKGTTNGPAVYPAGSAWVESGSGGITWNTRPALLGAAADNKGAIPKGAWVEYDVTSLVGGNGAMTLALVGDSGDDVKLSSREGGHAPQLVVTFSLASPTPTVTPTPSTSPTPTLSPTATATFPPPPPIQHVFVVVMENRGYGQVWNTTSAPYITQLGNSYARATNYHAITHPSLPNYLHMYGGSNYSISTNCSPSATCHVDARNLADNLGAKGLKWKGYMESMPAPCYLTSSGKYVPRHNPFIYFDNIRNNATRCNSHVVPYTALAADLASLATTPNFALISPNLCNDMHDCSVSTGDNWLKNNMPAILNSPACTVDKCLLILTWDEDDNHAGNRVLTVFAGSAAKTGGVTSAAPYTHHSLLRTIEYIFGLPTQTGNDAAASPMMDLLR